MATSRSVINTALRKLGVLAAGRDARDVDMADAFAALKGMYGAWIAAGAFGRLEDATPTSFHYTPYCGSRIYLNGDEDNQITLPELVGVGWFWDYGWYRCCGAYNPAVTPRDGMAVVITDSGISGKTNSWLFDGTIKKWQLLETLQLDDEATRSAADPSGLASCLAIEISDQYNGDVAQQTVRAASRFNAAMTHRFGMRREGNFNPEGYF